MMRPLTTDQVNYLNIGLMLLSCVVAFILPFELFLFSYAILGPLHYLTEISWLHKRQCFSPGKRDFIILAIFALAITIPNIFPHFYEMWGPKDTNGDLILSPEMRNFMIESGKLVPLLIYSAFAASALLILTKSTWKRVIGFVVIVAVGYMFSTPGEASGRFMFLAFSVFLPTLVHVFVFTGAFILVGALKSRSRSGVLSLLVFVGCAVSLFVLFPNTITTPGEYAMKTYDATFLSYSKQLFYAFMHQSATTGMIYGSPFGIMLARFIAFAYTYHYLNWFSKTSVIKWHKVPRPALITIIVIWILSIALYLTDYMTGIMALYFLSYVHVIFEFPLNFRSFKDIGTELWQRLPLARAGQQ